MRYALLVGLLLCLAVCGCDQQEVMNNGGHGVNLLPTDREVRGGER